MVVSFTVHIQIYPPVSMFILLNSMISGDAWMGLIKKLNAAIILFNFDPNIIIFPRCKLIELWFVKNIFPEKKHIGLGESVLGLYWYFNHVL